MNIIWQSIPDIQMFAMNFISSFFSIYVEFLFFYCLSQNCFAPKDELTRNVFQNQIHHCFYQTGRLQAYVEDLEEKRLYAY